MRLAWIIEDQGIRACADAWLARAGGRLLDAETRTFARVRPAIAWLIDERRSEDERTPAPWVAAPARGGAWG